MEFIDAEIPREDKASDYYEAHIIFDDAFIKKDPTKKYDPDVRRYQIHNCKSKFYTIGSKMEQIRILFVGYRERT